MPDSSPSFSRRVPQDDDRERSICDRCGFVDYQNPKLVAGVVATDDQDRIVMCRRAIEPRRTFWTLPAGFMELGESVEQAAAREAMEEACATLALDGVIGVFSLPRISQVQVFFRARLVGAVAPGPESLEVALFDWNDLPRTEFAFDTVSWALEAWHARRGHNVFAPLLRTLPA